MGYRPAQKQGRPMKVWGVRDTQTGHFFTMAAAGRDDALWRLAFRHQIDYPMSSKRFRVSPGKGNHADA